MNLNAIAASLIQEAHVAGIALFLDDRDRVQMRYAKERREKLQPLITKLRSLKTEVTRLLQEHERRLAFAYLAGHVNKKVWTPGGPALLIEVADYALVEEGDGHRFRWYSPDAVVPYA
jgi:hypothetical protein